MNRSEALAEARRRWGPMALVAEHVTLSANGEGTTRTVGYPLLACGSGITWEDALADADARAKGAKP